MTTFASDIVLEAFGAQLLPVVSEITLPAMIAFGSYNMDVPLLLALIGALLGVILLYAVGRMAARLMERRQPERYQQLSGKFRHIMLLLLLVVSSPLGFAIAFASGLFRVPLYLMLPISCIGLGLHYAARFT